jgi:hypothetical protein
VVLSSTGVATGLDTLNPGPLGIDPEVIAPDLRLEPALASTDVHKRPGMTGTRP